MIKTAYLTYYRLLKPGQVFADEEALSLKFNNNIKIVAIQATISSFPLLHTQVWLSVNGNKFGFVNSGSSGTANASVNFCFDGVDLKAGEKLCLGVWAHNMFKYNFLGLYEWGHEADFHTYYTIYYIEG